MISQCRICKQDMSDDNRTLVGKPFKACSRCRPIGYCIAITEWTIV